MEELFTSDDTTKTVSDIMINNKIIDQYYLFFNTYPKKSIWIPENISNFKKIWDSYASYNKLKNYLKIVFSKNTFHIDNDNNLYTEPQKSGSCAWFSLYWALIMHKIQQYDTYAVFKYIINLNDRLYDILSENAYAFRDGKYYDNNNNVLNALNLGNILHETGLIPDEKILSENKIIHYRTTEIVIKNDDIKSKVNDGYASEDDEDDEDNEDYEDDEDDPPATYDFTKPSDVIYNEIMENTKTALNKIRTAVTSFKFNDYITIFISKFNTLKHISDKNNYSLIYDKLYATQMALCILYRYYHDSSDETTMRNLNIHTFCEQHYIKYYSVLYNYIIIII